MLFRSRHQALATGLGRGERLQGLMAALREDTWDELKQLGLSLMNRGGAPAFAPLFAES